MRELKATDKITQKMTRDGAVSENLATGEVEHISSREPETELSASSEESAGAAADLALRAADHHEKKSARKAEKADTQAVRDGSAARQRPSSRLQFTEEERADPALGKYSDRSDRAADRLDAAKAAIAGAVLCSLMFNIALALVLSWDDDRQTVFLAKPVRSAADIVVTPLV